MASRVSYSKLAAHIAIHFSVMMGFWVLYTSTLKFGELLSGAGAAVLATYGTAIVQEQRFAQVAPRPKWLLYFALMPWYAVRDTAIVFRAGFKYMLKRKSDGYLTAIDFDPGGDDPRSTARRALEIALTTIPPNSIVIGIDRHARKILLHMVARADASWVTRQLGAKP